MSRMGEWTREGEAISLELQRVSRARKAAERAGKKNSVRIYDNQIQLLKTKLRKHMARKPNRWE